MGRGQIPSMDYGEFSKRLQSRAIEKRIPVTGSFDLTSRCNLRCIHCYIQGTYWGNELTYTEICGILDQLAEEGCLWLVLTGGEPLTRPDFPDIYMYAKKLGLFITLFTNATLITQEIADFLAEFPPFVIEISLYGITKETYEKVTRAPGSYAKFRRGIELLAERNLKMKFKSMAFTVNYNELWDMKRFADSLNVPFRFDCMLNARLDGSHKPNTFRLPADDIVALDIADKERTDAWCSMSDRFGETPDSEYLYTCGAGVNNFHISSSGGLNVCTVSREPNYDLRQGSFHDGFYNAFPEVRAQKRTRYSECQDCDLKGICAQCPAWGQLEHGDPEAKVDFLCEVTHLRAATLQQVQELRQTAYTYNR